MDCEEANVPNVYIVTVTKLKMSHHDSFIHESFIPSLFQEPVSRRQCADIFWTGGLSSGHNRWFDKSIQIMCSRNGKAGLIGEHSMMDGMPMIDLADYVTKQTYKDVQLKSSSAAAASSSAGGVENIFQDCVEDISSEDSRVDSLLAKGMIVETH